MMKVLRRACLLAVVGILAGVLVGAQAQKPESSTGKLRVYFVDVEGGQATLFVTPKGESLLIDRYASIDVLLYMTEQRMMQAGLLRPKDMIAFTTGMPVGAGGTNLLKIHEIPG